VGKIPEKAVCRSVFLTNMALYFGCQINKTALLQTVFFLVILPTGISCFRNLRHRPHYRRRFNILFIYLINAILSFLHECKKEVCVYTFVCMDKQPIRVLQSK